MKRFLNGIVFQFITHKVLSHTFCECNILKKSVLIIFTLLHLYIIFLFNSNILLNLNGSINTQCVYTSKMNNRRNSDIIRGRKWFWSNLWKYYNLSGQMIFLTLFYNILELLQDIFILIDTYLVLCKFI